MMGEDYRSQAYNNAMKIIELQEVVTYLKAEPLLYKE